MAAKIKLALHVPSNRIIHIDAAENGKACNCQCLECYEMLVAKQGDIRDNHFSHDTNSDCPGAQETALHQFGKEILVANNQIVLPQHGTIFYDSPKPEKKLDSIRPDVSAFYGKKEIYFEIAVTHFIEVAKEDLIRNGRLRCVEIDLAACYELPEEQIKYKVLLETANKKLYGWGPNYNWLWVAGIVSFFVAFFFGGKNRR